MSHASFDHRLSRLSRRRRRSPGVTYQVGPDGLLTAEPPRRSFPRVPLRPLLSVFAVAFGLKAALFVSLGEGTYESRRDLLLHGTVIERGAAWVMQPDPGVRAVATLLERLAPG